jgi:putative FmdB family regulatory protein
LPIYEYRCANGHTFEVMQSMIHDPIQSCEVCGAPVERVFHPVAVHFKGSGFYTTDYGRKRGAGAESGGDSSGDSAGSESKGETKSESKSETKTGGSKSDSKETAASKSDSGSSSGSDS